MKKQFVSFWLRQLPWQLSSPDAPDPVAAEKFENFSKSGALLISFYG